MSTTMQRRGLRTKTGCLTCRSRRKKCNESFPICKLCNASGRDCLWPTSSDLQDRRFASQHRSRHQSTSPKPPSPIVEEVESPALTLCLASQSTAHRELTRDLEVVVSRHFVEKYFGLLLLPNCHPDFHNGWIDEIQVLMVDHKCLHYSVLANAASHMHFTDASAQMQELALTYYSNSLKELSKTLAKASQVESHNGLLMSVIFLYLHGCMGRGTYSDIPRHVDAATKILTLRLFDGPSIFNRPFDRLAVESVLYQIFLVTTGLWSDTESLDYSFDTGFWLQAEKLLDKTAMFPERSNIFNSPVLGVSVALFRLALTLKKIYQRPQPQDKETLLKLQEEVAKWESVVSNGQEIELLSLYEQQNQKHEYYTDASYLYILNISLLFQQILKGISNVGPPLPVSSDCWQIRQGIDIIKRHRDDDDWKWCFIGNWPTYTFGFFLSEQENIDVVRADMERRWELTKFAQLARFSSDLKRTWSERDLLVRPISRPTFP